MEFDKVLRRRESVRGYKKKKVSWNDLADILEAGTLAPSSGNVQNWIFIVVREQKNIEKVVNLLSKEQSWAANASALVVVCSDGEQIRTLFGERGSSLYAIQNCAAAIQNMILKAADLKIGSCWIGLFDEKKVAKQLKVGKDIRPQAILAFGYGEALEEKSREPLESCIFFEEYGNKDRKADLFPLGSALRKRLKK